MLALQGLVHDIVQSPLGHQVLNVDRGSLPDAVGAVFRLQQLTHHPVELGEDNEGGTLEVQTLPAGCDGQKSNLHSIVRLELRHERPTLRLGRRPIDADVRRLDTAKPLLQGIEHQVVVREEEEARAGLHDGLDVVGHAMHLRLARSPRHVGDHRPRGALPPLCFATTASIALAGVRRLTLGVLLVVAGRLPEPLSQHAAAARRLGRSAASASAAALPLHLLLQLVDLRHFRRIQGLALQVQPLPALGRQLCKHLGLQPPDHHRAEQQTVQLVGPSAAPPLRHHPSPPPAHLLRNAVALQKLLLRGDKAGNQGVQQRIHLCSIVHRGRPREQDGASRPLDHRHQGSSALRLRGLQKMCLVADYDLVVDALRPLAHTLMPREEVVGDDEDSRQAARHI
mmetsp:Transcript_175436/g.557135  ORF Transcript_175436/g.557135 Transcript_175436/m.557135 type:complete len:397 (-) Transcript_175436:601-1791(-)